MSAQTFRRIPGEVQVLRWTGENADEMETFAGPVWNTAGDEHEIWNCTRDQWDRLHPGDWVIKDERDWYSVVKDEAFHALYVDPDVEVAAAREDAKKIGETIQRLMVLLRDKDRPDADS